MDCGVDMMETTFQCHPVPKFPGLGFRISYNVTIGLWPASNIFSSSLSCLWPLPFSCRDIDTSSLSAAMLNFTSPICHLTVIIRFSEQSDQEKVGLVD